MIKELFKDEFYKIIELGKIVKSNFTENYIGDRERVFIYEESGEIIAFIQVLSIYETLEIINVVVHPSRRCEGVASKLLKYAFDLFNPKQTLLEVRESNVSALNLYKKYNFEIIRTIKNYYGNESAFVMERK